MVRGNDNVLVLNEHVSLPIIITDCDATHEDEDPANGADKRREERVNSTSTIESRSSAAPQLKWTTGFGQFIDDCWSRMTDNMKQKLRDACVEVLRRTDDVPDQGNFSMFDEDARMLD